MINNGIKKIFDIYHFKMSTINVKISKSEYAI